jgi:hypothetical protein
VVDGDGGGGEAQQAWEQCLGQLQKVGHIVGCVGMTYLDSTGSRQC